MKKVWDFLLLVVSGLLVFVAIIAVALWLTGEDEPPATADSRGESTENVVAAHATVPSASATVPESPATVTETAGATPAAVQHHESMAGAPASAPADSQSRHEETREVSPEQQLIERYEAMAARERALRQAEDRMAKAHERLVAWFSMNRKAVLEDLAYLEEKGRYQELHDRAGLFESLNDR